MSRGEGLTSPNARRDYLDSLIEAIKIQLVLYLVRVRTGGDWELRHVSGKLQEMGFLKFS